MNLKRNSSTKNPKMVPFLDSRMKRNLEFGLPEAGNLRHKETLPPLSAGFAGQPAPTRRGSNHFFDSKTRPA